MAVTPDNVEGKLLAGGPYRLLREAVWAAHVCRCKMASVRLGLSAALYTVVIQSGLYETRLKRALSQKRVQKCSSGQCG
jgi:hypothetical protein